MTRFHKQQPVVTLAPPPARSNTVAPLLHQSPRRQNEMEADDCVERATSLPSGQHPHSRGQLVANVCARLFGQASIKGGAKLSAAPGPLSSLPATKPAATPQQLPLKPVLKPHAIRRVKLNNDREILVALHVHPDGGRNSVATPDPEHKQTCEQAKKTVHFTKDGSEDRMQVQLIRYHPVVLSPGSSAAGPVKEPEQLPPAFAFLARRLYHKHQLSPLEDLQRAVDAVEAEVPEDDASTAADATDCEFESDEDVTTQNHNSGDTCEWVWRTLPSLAHDPEDLGLEDLKREFGTATSDCRQTTTQKPKATSRMTSSRSVKCVRSQASSSSRANRRTYFGRGEFLAHRML